MEIKIFSGFTTSELLQRKSECEDKIREATDSSLKNNDPWDVYVSKTRSDKAELFYIDKELRLRVNPNVDFNTDYGGKRMKIEEFIKKSMNGTYTDTSGNGLYATNNGVSNIRIYPSDIKEGLYRNDFTHVIWIDNQLT